MSNNTPNTHVEGVDNTQEKVPGKVGQLIETCRAQTIAALGTLALSTQLACAEPNFDASTLNIPENTTVSFVGGGTGELYKENGKFHIRNGNSENGRGVFSGTITIDGKVYLVSGSDETNVIEVSEYQSQIGIDYSKYGDMASNFLAGEVEYLASIEAILISKPENVRERMRGVYYRNYEKALDDLYNGDGQIKKAYLDLFQEKTPNMVLSWKGLPGYYGVIYENQQAREENQQAREENQQAREALEMARRLRGE